MNKTDLEEIAKIVNIAVENKMNSFEGKIVDRIDEFEERMTDKMFTFEQEYGTKIDTIYEIALMQKEKAQEVYDKQEKLNKKVE